ncbi:MAG: FCD domain-containing protein [Pseudomonadota bacterium]|nr:FCD domain-containing protein [Pseudomonadota bacterium]
MATFKDSMRDNGTPRRQKLAELIADDIKRWIVQADLHEGDRLPNEQALMQHYGCAKGTIRETLKGLEIEGLVQLKTGPGGGAFIQAPGMAPASRLLRTYLHFHQRDDERRLDGEQVYQLRKLLEVELARSLVGCLDERDFAALEANIDACEATPGTEDGQRQQRLLELEFHNRLAAASPKPLLAFMCRFLNDLLRDLVVYKRAYRPIRESFDIANQDYHRQLVEAFRAEDVDWVTRLMGEHMCDAERHMGALEAEVAGQMLVDREDVVSLLSSLDSASSRQ